MQQWCLDSFPGVQYIVASPRPCNQHFLQCNYIKKKSWSLRLVAMFRRVEYWLFINDASHCSVFWPWRHVCDNFWGWIWHEWKLHDTSGMTCHERKLCFISGYVALKSCLVNIYNTSAWKAQQRQPKRYKTIAVTQNNNHNFSPTQRACIQNNYMN